MFVARQVSIVTMGQGHLIHLGTTQLCAHTHADQEHTAWLEQGMTLLYLGAHYTPRTVLLASFVKLQAPHLLAVDYAQKDFTALEEQQSQYQHPKASLLNLMACKVLLIAPKATMHPPSNQRHARHVHLERIVRMMEVLRQCSVRQAPFAHLRSRMVLFAEGARRVRGVSSGSYAVNHNATLALRGWFVRVMVQHTHAQSAIFLYHLIPCLLRNNLIGLIVKLKEKASFSAN
jgi:hypothetical protein